MLALNLRNIVGNGRHRNNHEKQEHLAKLRSAKASRIWNRGFVMFSRFHSWSPAECCGILGYMGNEDALDVLVNGMELIKHRGNDSCGICTQSGNNVFEVTKCASRYKPGDCFQRIRTLVGNRHINSHMGMVHTRWSTVGRPNDRNAHPHYDKSTGIALVHNGTITNIMNMMKGRTDNVEHANVILNPSCQLMGVMGNAAQQCVQCGGPEIGTGAPETDSEALLHLLSQDYKQNDNMLEVIKNRMRTLKGSWGICIMVEKEPNTFYVTRRINPLLIGISETLRSIYISSECLPSPKESIHYFSLDDGETLKISYDTIEEILEDRNLIYVPRSNRKTSPLPFAHWMMKEIAEQPLIARVLMRFIRLVAGQPIVRGHGFRSYRGGNIDEFVVSILFEPLLAAARTIYDVTSPSLLEVPNETLTVGAMPSPSMTNGVMNDGIMTNWIMTNGAMPSPSMTNGVMTNGVMTNGVMTNGVVTNGVVTNGVVTNEETNTDLLEFDPTDMIPSVIFQRLDPYILTNVNEYAVELDLGITLPSTTQLGMEGLPTRINLVAMGSSRHAALFVASVMQSFGVEVEVDGATDLTLYRYEGNSIAIFVSQSGETLDTIEASKSLRELNPNCFQIAVVNSHNSYLTRMTNEVVYLGIGNEVALPSTKSFTSQVAVLLALVSKLASELHDNDDSSRYGPIILRSLMDFGIGLKQLIYAEPLYMRCAERLSKSSHLFILGTGPTLPIAMEGALKFKETSYLHAEAISCGEMKHGSLALISSAEQTPVIVIATEANETTSNCIAQLKARGAFVICIGNGEGDVVVRVPCCGVLTPALAVLPMQLMAYWMAVTRKMNPDTPRGLSKAITVL